MNDAYNFKEKTLNSTKKFIGRFRDDNSHDAYSDIARIDTI